MVNRLQFIILGPRRYVETRRCSADPNPLRRTLRRSVPRQAAFVSTVCSARTWRRLWQIEGTSTSVLAKQGPDSRPDQQSTFDVSYTNPNAATTRHTVHWCKQAGQTPPVSNMFHSWPQVQKHLSSFRGDPAAERALKPRMTSVTGLSCALVLEFKRGIMPPGSSCGKFDRLGNRISRKHPNACVKGVSHETLHAFGVRCPALNHDFRSREDTHLCRTWQPSAESVA